MEGQFGGLSALKNIGSFFVDKSVLDFMNFLIFCSDKIFLKTFTPLVVLQEVGSKLIITLVNMIIKYLLHSLSLAFISWIVGMSINGFLAKSESYERLTNLNFIKNEATNKRIGLGAFKWIVKNTFFKYFNPKLKLRNKVDRADLRVLRNEMTFSEISHLIGFIVIGIIVLMKFISGEYVFGVILLTVNIPLNLYPSLLQQENKRRIDELLVKSGA